MLKSVVVRKTTRVSRFFSSVSASRPSRSCHDRCSADGGISTAGRKKVNAATSSQNTAAGILKRKGLIEYTRGEIRILDVPGLTKTSCECYRSEEHTSELQSLRP